MKRILLSILGLILILDGLWLLSLDKIHLGIVLPIFIGAIFLITAVFYAAIQVFLARHPKVKFFWQVNWIGFWLWFISLAGFFAYLQYSTRQSAEIPGVKAILVLGSGIENGQPSPTLQARLDAAVPTAIKNPDAIMIMTGGFGMNESVSEAAVMRQYLLKSHFLPASRIYLEDQSTSTELNLLNSKAVLAQQHIGLDQPIAIATSDFHVPRAAAIAKHAGYRHIYTISAPTPLYIRYNSWLREYFAFLSGWLLHEY